MLTIIPVAMKHLQLCCLSFGKLNHTLGEVDELCYVDTEALVTHTRLHVVEESQRLVRHLSSHMTVCYRGNLIGQLCQLMEVGGK